MPSAATHRKVALYYLGYYTPWLQRAIDPPELTRDLKAEHRLLFHDFDFIKYIDGKLGRELAREALLHVILDLEEHRAEAKKVFPIPGKRRRFAIHVEKENVEKEELETRPVQPAFF